MRRRMQRNAGLTALAASRYSGFSLVEVICAMLILGIGLVGLIEGVTVALKTSKDSELHTTAALIAGGRIELLRAEGYLYEGEEEGDCGDDKQIGSDGAGDKGDSKSEPPHGN